MFRDKNGREIQNGACIHYKNPQDNPNSIPDDVPQELDGWAFRIRFSDESVLGLFTNDRDNNIVFTGLYYEDDGDPCYGLEVCG